MTASTFLKTKRPSSLDPVTQRYVEEADARRERDRRDRGLTFSSVRTALRWYFEAVPRMQSPHGMHPRTVDLGNGVHARIEVDGGRGGDLDDVLCTIHTIGKALAELLLDEPVRWWIVTEFAKGQSQSEIARIQHMSQQMVSGEVGKGEAYLAALLRDVLR